MGFEANTRVLKAGYAFLDLREDLTVRADVPPPNTRARPGTAVDVFATRNEFHGGQVEAECEDGVVLSTGEVVAAGTAAS